MSLDYVQCKVPDTIETIETRNLRVFIPQTKMWFSLIISYQDLPSPGLRTQHWVA